MNKNSELDCYLYWMWNVWSEDVCEKMWPNWYDPIYGNYMWGKWMNSCQICGGDGVGAAARFYAQVDDAIRRRIVEAAKAYYETHE